MNVIANWLEERPHRSTVINILMLTGLLFLMKSPYLFTVLGGVMLALAGPYFLLSAFKATRGWEGFPNLYQFALLWVPGTLAVCLAVVALVVIASHDAGSLAYGLSALLFGGEVALLAMAGADLGGRGGIALVSKERV